LNNPRLNKILVAAQIAGTPIELVVTDFSKLKEKEFLAKNPNGKVPTLEIKEGTYLWESNAILRYIARLGKSKGLYGNNEIDEAHVDQWVDWVTNELESHLGKMIYPVLGHVPFDKATNDKAVSDAMKALKLLDNHFASHQHLVGSTTTIADIFLASALVLPFKFLFEEKARKNFANVTKWFEAFV